MQLFKPVPSRNLNPEVDLAIFKIDMTS